MRRKPEAFFEGRTVQQWADELGITKSAFHSRLLRFQAGRISRDRLLAQKAIGSRGAEAERKLRGEPIKAWAARLGLSLAAMYRRVYKFERGEISESELYEPYKQRQFPEGTDSRSPEYGAWKNLFGRCYDPSNKWFHRYGGRGIVVCDRWRDPITGFAAFYEDMGPKPAPHMSVDRIDNDGIYEPGNCKWSTAKEQANNRSI